MTANKSFAKGNYTLQLEGQVLIDVMQGTWSKQAAMRFAFDFKQKIAEIDQQPWAHLVYLENWGLGEPAIGPIISELAQWAYANNNRYTGLVYSSSAIKTHMIEKILTVSQDDMLIEHFTTPNKAYLGLQKRGFAISSAPFDP